MRREDNSNTDLHYTYRKELTPFLYTYVWWKGLPRSESPQSAVSMQVFSQ